jgi:hypothetical protein
VPWVSPSPPRLQSSKTPSLAWSAQVHRRLESFVVTELTYYGVCDKAPHIREEVLISQSCRRRTPLESLNRRQRLQQPQQREQHEGIGAEDDALLLQLLLKYEDTRSKVGGVW